MSYQICKNCCMDSSAKEITFEEGICNFCHQAQKSLKEIKKEKDKLPSIIQRIKKDGRNNVYDCVIGLSGGVDSSTTLHYAVSLGLRPLCFSLDNGWDDPRANENVMKLVESLEVVFYRYNIDLAKFKSVQSAYLKAGVINIEAITDHILMAVSLEFAKENNIKWILSGGNVATESIMPASWSYSARDLTNIKSIYKWATGRKIDGLPVCGLFKWNYYKWVKGIKNLYLLDFLEYNRLNSEAMLIEKYGFQSTGEKHEESIWTKWFQNFYLFEKFGIDKRKAHYSSLIKSGQMTRKEAMAKLQENPIYPKLGIEDRVMKYPSHSHYDFKTDERLFNFISRTVKLCRKIKST